MAINKNKSDIKRTSQNVLVNSYDEDFNILAVEKVSMNPAGDSTSASADRTIDVPLAIQVATDSGDSNIEYVGFARTGESTANAVWRVMKVNSTTGTVVTWADGNSNFDNIFDNRETLNYS